MIGSPAKKQGVYRLLKNGGWKTGCTITKSKGIRGRVLEQITEKINGKSAEEVNQILENDSGI